jgi:hypothetical protein
MTKTTNELIFDYCIIDIKKDEIVEPNKTWLDNNKVKNIFENTKLIEDLFFNFVFCRKCKMKEKSCKCEIMEPIIELPQLGFILKELKKVIDKC